MEKQTAVEWLIDQLEKYELYSKISFQCLKEIEEAKEMEKQQIIDAVKYGYNGHKIGHYTPNFREQQELFEQYYKKTYVE